MIIKDHEVERVFVQREKELIGKSKNLEEAVANLNEALSWAASEEVICAAIDQAFEFSPSVADRIAVCKTLATGSPSQIYAVGEILEAATNGDDCFAVFFEFPTTVAAVVQKVLGNNYTISPEHLGLLCQSRLINTEQKQALLKKLKEALAEENLTKCLQARNYVAESGELF